MIKEISIVVLEIFVWGVIVLGCFWVCILVSDGNDCFNGFRVVIIMEILLCFLVIKVVFSRLVVYCCGLLFSVSIFLILLLFIILFNLLE